MRYLVTFVVACSALYPGVVLAQPFAFGVKGGVRATDDFSGFSLQSAESKRYIVGPTVEVRLPWRFAFEFDALYRRVGFTRIFSNPFATSLIRERDNSWEFPLVVKRRFWGGPARPFLGGGYDPRRVTGTDISSGSYLSGLSTTTYVFNQKNDTNYSVTHGLLVSGGIDLNAGRIHVAPEIRYIHWNRPFFEESGSSGTSQIQSAQNELFVMVGITWR